LNASNLPMLYFVDIPGCGWSICRTSSTAYCGVLADFVA